MPFCKHLQSNYRPQARALLPPSQEGAGGYLTSIHCYCKCLLQLALGKVTSPESWKLSSVKSCNWKVHALILECLTHLQPQYHLPQEALLESPPAPQYSSLSYNCGLMPTMCPSLDVRPCRGDSNWKKRQHWVSFLFSWLLFSLRTGPSLCHVATETQIESHTFRLYKPEDRIWGNPSSWKMRYLILEMGSKEQSPNATHKLCPNL